MERIVEKDMWDSLNALSHFSLRLPYQLTPQQQSNVWITNLL